METRIVEINGVKLEIDLRQAKTVENYKVGDSVKVLMKRYGDTYASNPGVIIGFDNFVALPTIIIAYLEMDYSSGRICFAHLNSATKDIEICPANENETPIQKSHVVDMLNREILKKQEEAREAENKLEYFLKYFECYFGEVK